MSDSNTKDKIPYEPPRLIDLSGGVAHAQETMGLDCRSGSVAAGQCYNGSVASQNQCKAGSSAGKEQCQAGDLRETVHVRFHGLRRQVPGGVCGNGDVLGRVGTGQVVAARLFRGHRKEDFLRQKDGCHGFGHQTVAFLRGVNEIALNQAPKIRSREDALLPVAMNPCQG